MGAAVLVFWLLGASVGGVLLVVGFEAIAWLGGMRRITRPYLKATLGSLALGLLFLILTMQSASGEGGLAFLALSPVLLLGFLCAGFLVGLVYKSRGRPLVPARKRALAKREP